MLSAPSIYTTLDDADARQPEITSQRALLSNHEGEDLLSPLPKVALRRHYTSLQEHADNLHAVNTVPDNDDGLTLRHEGRRESVVWDFPLADESVRHSSRNPLLPQQLDIGTPPPLEEILWRSTNKDDKKSLPQVESFNTRSLRERLSRISTAHSTSSDHGTTVSSIADFARGVSKHVPDMRMFSLPGTVAEPHNHQERSGLDGGGLGESTESSRLARRLSSMLPSVLRQTNTVDRAPEPTSASREPTITANLKELSKKPPAKSSLRDRRKVNLDLSLPQGTPNLPIRSRGNAVHFSNNTPSRPWSPQTPWTRVEQPKWQYGASPKTKAIIEEDYNDHVILEKGNDQPGLLPDNDRIGSSSSSPRFERPSPKVRDRCYTTRPRFKRSRSVRSGTTDSSLSRTPDRSWSPNDVRDVPQEQQARTKAELQQLGQASKTASASRWRWARSLTKSSDEGNQAPGGESRSRRFSVSAFKRSGRISDQMLAEEERRQSPSPPGRLWWISKQSVDLVQPKPPSTPANPPAPPPFLPPALNRVPTPPVADVDDDVKERLAHFVFEHGAGIARKKPKANLRGHWDSDALLMSYISPDMDLENDTNEEGPEGHLSPNSAPRGFTVDQNTIYRMPGLVTAPDEYLNVEDLRPGQIVSPAGRSPEVGDVWFRVRQPESLDEGQFTGPALRELAKRRKFEWVVPEHLPDSPLCPLHPKYQGYDFGMCYWHDRRKPKGRTSDGQSGKVRSSTRQWQVGKVESMPVVVKKRRWASLSSP